jgi:hypothetical protein
MLNSTKQNVYDDAYGVLFMQHITRSGARRNTPLGERCVKRGVRRPYLQQQGNLILKSSYINIGFLASYASRDGH